MVALSGGSRSYNQLESLTIKSHGSWLGMDHLSNLARQALDGKRFLKESDI
jgi:hypothetical protein